MNYQVRKTRSGLPRSPKELFFYFLHLDEREIEHFKTCWKKIKNANINAMQLVGILHKIAKNLSSDNQKIHQYAGIITYIENNKSIWENRAIEQMDSFKPQQLALSLWAFATLGITPSKYFMKAWTSRLEDTIDHFNDQNLSNSVWALAVLDSIETNLRYRKTYDRLRSDLTLVNFAPIAQKQNYDADLWFRGFSHFENPKKYNQIPESDKILCTIFNKAGFKAKIIRKPVIKSLPQAIDIQVFDPKTKQTIYIELDGNTHFLNTRMAGEQLRYNGASLFRANLTSREAPTYHILHIDTEVYEKIKKWHKNDARTSTGKRKADLACRLFFNKTIDERPTALRAQMDLENPVVSMTGKSAPQITA